MVRFVVALESRNGKVLLGKAVLQRGKAQVVGLGAGGHGRVLIEAVRLVGTHIVAGLLDSNPRLRGTRTLGVLVLGGDHLLVSMKGKGIRYFFVGVGSVGDMRIRRRIFNLGLKHKLEPVTVIHPTAIVSPSVKVGRGAAILAGAIINSQSELGENVIINTGAIIEHDCWIGAHTHVATGATLAGGVVVGEGAHVGIGASVRQGVRIGKRSIVGAGAAIVGDVPDGVIMGGVPARILKEIPS